MYHASSVRSNEAQKVGRQTEEREREKGESESARGAPTFYLLYRLPRLAVKGLHNQQLEGVIHKTVLHIRQKKEQNHSLARDRAKKHRRTSTINMPVWFTSETDRLVTGTRDYERRPPVVNTSSRLSAMSQSVPTSVPGPRTGPSTVLSFQRTMMIGEKRAGQGFSTYHSILIAMGAVFTSCTRAAYWKVGLPFVGDDKYRFSALAAAPPRYNPVTRLLLALHAPPTPFLLPIRFAAILGLASTGILLVG